MSLTDDLRDDLQTFRRHIGNGRHAWDQAEELMAKILRRVSRGEEPPATEPEIDATQPHRFQKSLHRRECGLCEKPREDAVHGGKPEPEPVPPRVDPDANHRFVLDSAAAPVVIVCTICGYPERDARHHASPAPTRPPRPEPEPTPEPPRPTPGSTVVVLQWPDGSQSSVVPRRHGDGLYRASLRTALEVRVHFDAAGRAYCAEIENGYLGVGAVEFRRIDVVLNGVSVLRSDAYGAIPPGMGLIALDWDVARDLCPDNEPVGFPSWVADQCGELLGQGGAISHGAFDFFWYQKGKDAPGGYGIAPYHGGREDWLQCQDGRLVRLMQAAGDFQRPFRCYDDTGEPLYRPDVRFWLTGAQSELALPGMEWPAGLYGWPDRFDLDHFNRIMGPVASIASWFPPARRWVRMLWTLVQQAYSMEGPDETDLANRILFTSLRQRIELTKPGAQFGRPHMHGFGGRNLAHAIRALWNAAPWLPESEVREYAAGFAALVENLADANGVVSRGWGGQDGQKFLKAPYSLSVPIELTFQEELTRNSILLLTTLPGGEAALPAKRRGDRFWIDAERPYCFETHYQNRATPMARLRGGDTAVALYRAMTTEGSLGGYMSLDDMDADAETLGVLSDMQPYDCLMPEARPWGSER